VGEAGLDKRKGPGMNIQLSCWKAQFALAQETGLPIIVHCVRAWEEMLPFVRSTGVPMMFHDFRGSLQLMESFAKQDGIYFSFGISLLQSEKCSLVFSHIPENRFLLETDQSALSIASVYRAAAKIRGRESSELEGQVKKNAIGFFGEKVLSFF
jgi:TatD DNase family protein